MFTDRIEAGEKLAQAIKDRNYPSIHVFGVPRGGVIVGLEVARILEAPFSILVARKIGAPLNKEFAIGAVSPDGEVVLNEEYVRLTGATEDYIKEEAAREAREARRRMELYGFPPPRSLQGKTAVLVDDGVATGYTMIASLKYVRKLNPDNLVVAVPVAPPDSVERLKQYADDVVVLHSPVFFQAVGQFYYDFHQVTDDEVLAALKEFDGRSEQH